MVEGLTTSQLMAYCRDRGGLYDNLRRNQYWCPPLKDTIMSMDFMIGVINS